MSEKQPRSKAPNAKKTEPKTKKERQTKEPLVVFAIRLTEAERNAIHEAAGPRNATQFVRAVALAASREDDAALKSAIHEARKLRS